MGHQFNSEIVKWQTDNYYIITLIRPHQFNFFFVRHLMKKARGVERLNGKIIILGVHKSIKFERTIIFLLLFSDLNLIVFIKFYLNSGSTSKKLNYGGLTLVIQKKIDTVTVFYSTDAKKGDWIRTISDIMGYEKASKSEKETQFQNMIETFQNEKKELDGELNFLRERYLIYEENIYSIIYLKVFLYAYVII